MVQVTSPCLPVSTLSAPANRHVATRNPEPCACLLAQEQKQSIILRFQLREETLSAWLQWGKLHNEELNSLYSSPNIVRVTKSRMRWTGHVARMEEGRGVHKVFWGNLRERDHWGDQDVDGRIILRWILRKWEGVVTTGWSWVRIGTGGGRLRVR